MTFEFGKQMFVFATNNASSSLSQATKSIQELFIITALAKFSNSNKNITGFVT